MAQFINMFPVELTHGPAIANINPTYQGNANANRIGAIVTEYGHAVALGGRCAALCVRSDGNGVPLAGVVRGNQAYAVLDGNCYQVPGRITIFVTWTSDASAPPPQTIEDTAAETTLVCVYGTVVSTTGGAMLQPVEHLPDYAQLLAAISDMEDATEAAEAAAAKAVRYDTAQELTNAQKLQARENIAAADIFSLEQIDDCFQNTLVPKSWSGITLETGKYIVGSTGASGNDATCARSNVLNGYGTRFGVNLSDNDYEYKLSYYDATHTESAPGETGYISSTSYRQGTTYIPANAARIAITARHVKVNDERPNMTDAYAAAIKAALTYFKLTDASLTVENAAADAKATGDKLLELEGFTAPHEDSSTAAAAHSVGTYFVMGGTLYRATRDIAIGDTIDSGTNCSAITTGLGGQIANFRNYYQNKEQGDLARFTLLTGNEFLVFEPGGMDIALVGGVNDISRRELISSYFCCIADCSPGDKFICKLVGGGYGGGGHLGKRAWAYLDSSNTVLSAAPINASYNGEVIDAAPAGAAKVVFQTKSTAAASGGFYVVRGGALSAQAPLFSAANAVQLAAGDDCDNLTPGTYSALNGTVSANVAHAPFPKGFLLFVFRTTAATDPRYSQIAIPNDETGQLAYRIKVQNWGNWMYLASDAVQTQDYVSEEAEEVAARVRPVQTARTLTMISVSDMHYWDGEPVIQPAIDDMAHGCEEIHKRIHVDYDVNFGDTIYAMTAGDGRAAHLTYAMGETDMNGATKLLAKGFGLRRQIRLVGNHDPNALGSTNNGFSLDRLYNYFGAYNECLNRPDQYRNRSYGYVDDDYRKMRIICLNTSDFADRPDEIPIHSNENKMLSTAQTAWLVDKLDLSGKGEDAKNWLILLLSHVPMDSSDSCMPDGYPQLLLDYENGGSGTLNSVQYDFSGKNAAQILHIHGHTHTYTVTNVRYHVSGETHARMKMPRIAIPHALPGRGGAATFPKTAGTRTSTCFVVNTIDPDRKIVWSHHYGAGWDRAVHYVSMDVSAGGTVAPLEPEFITTPTSWESNNDNIVTVEGAVVQDKNVGVLTLQGNGNTMVCAVDANGNREYWNLHVTV